MLATTTNEPAVPETSSDEASARRIRVYAWLAAISLPAVLAPLWCSLVPTWWGSLSALVLVLMLATSAVTDTATRRIPNWLTYTGVMWGLGINLCGTLLAGDEPEGSRLIGPAFLGAIGIGEALLGLAAAFAFGLPCYLLGKFSAGDVKLCAAIAAILGWRLGLLSFCTGFILAGGGAACWVIWILGPIGAIEWLVRKVGSFLLPTLIAPPGEEVQTAVDRPMALGIFFAIGVPLALILGGTP